ncbi:MAG: phage holin family protein [Bifidobacteriaceae bacterium]|nr:phage holin family protein [Bifidobacteriaceae bacterium]
MVAFGWRIVVNAIALWIVDALWGSMRVVTNGHVLVNDLLTRILAYLVIGLVLALVNAIVKPLVHVVALPLYILTVGLFSLIANALLLKLVSWLTGHMGVGLQIDSFGTAVGAALVLAILTAIISIPFRKRS